MNFAGIDPGKGGALAIVSGDMREAFAWDFPGSIEAAADLLREVFLAHHPLLTGIEKVGAMPKQGVSSTFAFGQNYGAWLGALATLQAPHILVTPGKWQKSLLDSSPGDTKQRSLSMANQTIQDVRDTGSQ